MRTTCSSTPAGGAGAQEPLHLPPTVSLTPVEAVLHLDNLDSGVPALAGGLGLRVLEVPGVTLLY